MKKILLAAGLHGKHDNKTFNWCNEEEPVGIHGFVCDNYCDCGCDCSFQGVDTSKSTTLAVVDTATDEYYDQIVERLRQTTLKGWKSSAIADKYVESFHLLSQELTNWPVLQQVKVDKGCGWKLIKA